MKTLILGSALVLSAGLMTGCTVTETTYSTGYNAYNTDYVYTTGYYGYRPAGGWSGYGWRGRNWGGYGWGRGNWGGYHGNFGYARGWHGGRR